MLKIKLSRTGKKNQANYRIVVAEAKSKRDGKFIENLGYYITDTTPSQLKLNLDRLAFWISQGAQPTDTVRALSQKTTSNELISLPPRQNPKPKKTKKTS